MLRKRKNLLTQIYRRDPITNCLIIEVSLNKYSDVFNEWDPAPFKNRDIDPDLKTFLEDSSTDIPLELPICLEFHIPRSRYSARSEEQVKSGLENNFIFMIHTIMKEVRRTNKRTFLYILISFVFLFSAYFLKGKLNMNVFLSILLEGQFIGGWVFLWEAFSLFFFTNNDLRKKLKTYRRFLDTEIRFVYTELNS